MRTAKDYLAPGEAAALLAHGLPLLHLADDALPAQSRHSTADDDTCSFSDAAAAHHNARREAAREDATASSALAVRALHMLLAAWLEQRTAQFETSLAKLEASIERCASLRQ